MKEMDNHYLLYLLSIINLHDNEANLFENIDMLHIADLSKEKHNIQIWNLNTNVR